MPKKRRPIVRFLLDPSQGSVKAKDVEDVLGVSRPTANESMRKIVALDIADWVDIDDGRETMVLQRKPEFEWPDSLDFPESGGR
jgi:DNA-binding FadR family transcriptional regulator